LPILFFIHFLLPSKN